jgi:plasmid stabilization system protein ParE
MGHLDAALGHHFDQVPVRQPIRDVPPHAQPDDVGVETRPGFLELFVRFGRSAYVVRCQVTDDAVTIIRVWHGRQPC